MDPITPQVFEKLVKWRWEWNASSEEDLDPKWKPFDAETIAILEEAFNNGDETVTLTHGFFGEQGGYTVNFPAMTQTKLASGYNRQLQRIEDNGDLPQIAPTAPTGAAPPGFPDNSGAWEWNSSGAWVPYDHETNLLICDAYSKKSSTLHLNHGYFSGAGGYTLDFRSMVQIRDSTGNSRQIRRNPPAKKLPGFGSVPAPNYGYTAPKPSYKPAAPKERLETVRCDQSVALGLRNALALISRRERDLPQEAPAEDIYVD